MAGSSCPSLEDLNRFFLQDAAAMAMENEGRDNHKMYQHLHVFRMPEWDTFCETMKTRLDTDDSPVDAKLEHVIPGLSQWHRTNDANLRRLTESLVGQEARLDARLEARLEAHSLAVVNSMKKEIALGLANAAVSIGRSNKPPPKQPQRPREYESNLDELADLFSGQESPEF